jgi:hypothetical protein
MYGIDFDKVHLTPVGYLDLKLALNASSKLYIQILSKVTHPGTTIPAALNDCVNCCWVNVWLATLYVMGVRMSANDSDLIIRRILAAGSGLMSTNEVIGDIITRIGLEIEVVEYNLKPAGGIRIGSQGVGPIVAFVNVGAHYQVHLTRDSELRKPFEELARRLAPRLAQEESARADQMAAQEESARADQMAADERAAHELSEQLNGL